VYLVDNRLLGQGLDIWNTNIYTPSKAQYQAVAVATGLRGPANGFIGDFYHWEDPYGVLDSRRRQGALASSLQDAASVDPLSPGEARAMQDGPASAAATVGEYLNPIGTLDYLRAGRDKGLITIVNSRGYPNWFAWPGSDNP
jgi:hypothetical protein